MVYNETFTCTQEKIDSTTVVHLLDPTQYSFNPVNHDFTLSINEWGKCQRDVLPGAGAVAVLPDAGAAVRSESSATISTQRPKQRTQLTSSDLTLTDVDHGYVFLKIFNWVTKCWFFF